MSNNLNKKLLAEAFDALVQDNDVAKATRLFKRHWDLAAKSSYALLESADEDFEVSDMGDDFNNEVVDEMGSDSEEKFNQAQIAVDELEDKFPAEVTDEIKAKFDDVRNCIDELKLSEEGEDNGVAEDASVALEELRGEFEMAGELSDEVSDLFDEISKTISGEEDLADADSDAEDVADDEDFDGAESDNADDMLGEADESLEDEFDVDDEDEKTEEGEQDVEDADADVDSDEDSDEDSYEDVQRDEDEVIDDIKYSAEDLAKLIDELEDIEKDEKDAVEEGFTKVADPRKKLSSEEEGVNKKGTMNFGKLPGMKLNAKAGINNAGAGSKGQAPSAKAKVCSTENKGAKSWHKAEKPANNPTAGKSMMGN